MVDRNLKSQKAARGHEAPVFCLIQEPFPFAKVTVDEKSNIQENL